MTSLVLDHQQDISWDDRIRAEGIHYKTWDPFPKAIYEINPLQLRNASRELKDETE